MCPWAAARPLAVRAASCARRVVSKPGQAPPPPTGTAARPSGPSGALHTGGACCYVLPGQAPPPPTGTAAWPLLGPRPSHPALAPLIPEPTPNFACNSPKTISNLEFRSLELQHFQTLLKPLPIKLHATFLRQAPPPRLKPMTPLRAPWHTRLKLMTPLLAQNSQIQAIFRPQRHRWFH